MGKAKRQGQKEAELAQENKSVINAITAMMRRLEQDAPTTAARFDGSSLAESFLRELERSPEFQNSSCDEQGRMVVAALEGEPRKTLQSMDYLYEPYWKIKQVLEDLYPPPETQTHQEFYQLRCGPQGLQAYYSQKVRIGTQLNIDRKEMVNALTQGMLSYSRNLLLIATPSSPSEWLTLARKIYGIGGDPSRPGISSPTERPSPCQSGRWTSNPLRRLSEDVPHCQKRPEGSPSTAPTPCKHCQGPHWNNQCPQRSTLPRQRADHPRLSTPPRYFRDPRDNTTKENIGLFPIDKFSVPALNIDPVKIIPNSDKIITLRPYRIPYSDYPEIKYQKEKMLENEIIEPSNSPYAAPVTLVRKGDGSKRFCVDFRKLNELMTVDNYPIPLIETVLDQLSNSKYFSTIDITSAFWQIPIHPESRPLLSFVTHLGQYHFNRLPFGLKLSPQIFERQLNQLIQKHKLTFANHYFDDFIIHSNSLEEHLRHLQDFFHFCKLENIKLNLNKCQFFKTSIDYLGYKISSGTCTPLVRNIDVINAIKPPTNVKTLQSFLGAINVYNKFIPDYARIRNSLNQLLKKNVKWEWRSDCQKAFDKLKQLLSYQVPFSIFINQIYPLHPDGNSYPVQYYSRTLRKYERNYTITELECLAIIETVDRFKVYLAGNCFTIFTDHCALQYRSAKNYLHVIVDHATRFAWTFPSRSTSTTTYIQVIKKVLQSGCPKRLLTDRAPAITSPMFRRFLISHNIQPMLTTSNHPQANGLYERLNATLTGKLRLLHLQHPRASWTMLQPKVVKAYNDTPHSVTGFPPSYLMDGSLPKELSQHLDPYPSVTESRRLVLQRTKKRHKLDKIRFDKNHRFCVDYRKLNNVTVKDVYPIPRIDKVMDTLQGTTYFSAIDLRSGYWQVEVKERDKEKTAFTTAHGLYEFNVMPFGLCNAPATFERNMENILGNLRWQICLCYLDDVIIYSPDFPTHLKRLEAVFRCFRESNLRLNDKKCQFSFEELEILSYITSKHGIKPTEHNINAVRNFPRPTKVKEVQSFLGMQEEAFQTLKTELLSPPILGHFNPNAPTHIHTDASNISIGATLVQDIGGEEKVISYLSRTLSKAEQNYSTTEKECLAVVWSMSKLWPYLYGRHFKIPIPPANFPFERIGIDFVGPLPSTKNRKKWIIVLTDYYTRYAETRAVSEATVKEVSKFLVEDIFLRHGAPQYLISDRALNLPVI
ncbi:K02A2.6-like [Cordylochernes scorpioides]|uniref:K02A2.6-like n=1 Tax=Cordylochernes scorpioides TaxID=51811 RepID=A0ABY6LGJ6_9ARAC|nr:K02A2.6-like [Cordylochernes scorpioides]